ncbi:MAG TPA: penicillin-binding transpeptidase domain-containing protein [Pseudomonadales bacterium]|jgi:cell division protein FtsI (penicillin-binding protein 3)|nr:penicillin-binding transpeptidase domain-containing protein [Pseudomonadales bacterium]|tara:strand:+ start:2073 stop:3731 length:1659 start_codon:yes stop_codon:yes gene_type:complete
MILESIRVHLVILAFVIMTGAMCARVIYLHAFDNDFLQDQGDARTIRMERINAHRGMIRDRQGKPLAVSTPVVSLWANPQELLKNPDKLDFLALLLEVPPSDFEKKLGRNAAREFVYLRRHMPPPNAQRILDLGIKGVYGEREYQRFYPAGEVAAHLVGFTNVDDRGQEGVELSYNTWLEGKPGKKKVLKNLYGEIIRDVMPVDEMVAGKSLDLSIDLRLQYLAYRELKSAINYYKAESGAVVILDVESGAVLSLVNQPSYNPNNRVDLDLASIRNRAVTDIFEPGSTVKPFTVAVALRSGEYQRDSTIDTSPGFIKVGKKTILDPRNMGVLDLGGIIAKSSQVGITKLALSLNEYEIYTMFSEVGFGQSAGIGFPGESNGYLPNRRRWSDIERATFAYGYGLQVTPLQLAAAYQVIASGGVKKSITLLTGQNVESRRVLGEEISDDIKKMLARVITEGTGSKASINAYSVAGKTGTARKVGKAGYEDTRHLAFFVGMTPVIRPRLVGVVMINDPKGDKYGGGAIAAPLFSKIMSEALRLLNVPPDNLEEAA